MSFMVHYIPLRLHSEFSIEDGIVRLKDAIHFAKEQQFPALGLSDLMNYFGMIKFYKACRQAGIKPIFGLDVLMHHEDQGEPTHLLLIAQNHHGYLTLCDWMTRSYLAESHKKDRAQMEWSWFDEDTHGLICLSGAQQGRIGQLLIEEQYEEAKQLSQRLARQFPNAFYLEIQRLFDVGSYSENLTKQFNQLKNNADINLRGSLQIAEELNLPVVATHPTQFLHTDDFQAHEARVCIAAGDVLGNQRRIRHFHPSQYYLSDEEMYTLFQDLPEALENSVQIARRCHIEITLGKNFLPNFPTPDGLSLDDFLVQEANQGLETRMATLYPDEAEKAFKLPEYQERLQYELDTIIQMGFPGYFLIVADFINWAKKNGCPVGPGRGSGAGSLVAYALKITDLDPLKYALLFERFLNPERVSMPDFDIDFCQENRWRVIDYVREYYGQMAVSQIITFGTLSSKAVIRDVGRVLELPFMLCDKLSKLIPLEANKPLSLEKAVEVEPEINRLLKAEEADELLVLAKKLEDLTRGTGMHAGGVLIAPGKLTDFCPVYQAMGEDSASVSMYDKGDVEDVGLVKFDFLGLRNLTIIKMAEDFIQEYRQEVIDISHIPLDDAQAYQIFKDANTTAVFQFESTGMKRMLLDAKPSHFEEIIAFVALYRPGPMDLIPDFIARMHGESFQYLHPLLEEVLKPTYGIMVYQEQVMQAAQVCGGYSLGGADLLRRAMGKKKVEEMVKQRAVFVEGAAQKGISAEKANEIFDYMEKFAGYGFNKSHAAAYALIAYQTAWLKAHYTAEFMSATMSSELDNTDQLKIFFDDAKENGIKFLPPSINYSDYRFKPVSPTQIRYALGAIKGTGEGAVESIINARQSGPFIDLFDFCTRVDKQAVNKRTLEALIRAGAFDEVEENRAKLFANIGLAIDYAEQKSANALQGGLFDFDASAIEPVSLQEMMAWNLSQKLAEEKLALGFYLSGHPFEPYKEEVKPLARQTLAEIKEQDYNQWLAGFVTQVRSILTKSGKKLWIVLLEDTTAKREIVIRDESLDNMTIALEVDRVLLFECRVNKDDRNGGIRINADKIVNLDQARQFYARSLQLNLQAETDLTVLCSILKQYQQAERLIPILIHYQGEYVQASLNASNHWRIIPKQELLNQLYELLGYSAVNIRW